MTTSTLSTDDQFALVYAGIQAVAANCDGAVEDDGVGFNGQDTKFGKRIASVPFEDWSADVKAEAARIAARYRKQIEASIGLDITTLPVVQEAQGRGTNVIARNQARGFENMGKKAERKATLRQHEGIIDLSWSNKDPDCFGVLLSDVKRLPGRRWTGSVNQVAVSAEALDFIEAHDLAADFDLAQARASLVVAAANAPVAEPVEAKPNVVLVGTDRVNISFPFDADMVAAVRNLPGRQYVGATKSNLAALHPDVLAFADAHGLVVAPEVREALANIEVVVSAEQAEKDLRKTVSGLANPADLPADFVQRVLAATPKAQVA